MISVSHQARDDASSRYPLRLNTGRYRDQWHTMTRTGLSPKLSQHRREPLVEVHPDVIGRMGLSDGNLARVETPSGSSIFRVASSDNQRRGELFVPIHWTDQTSGGGRAGLLPGQDRDPHSGQPGFKNTPVTIAAYVPKWQGFLISRDLPEKPDCQYWTRIRTAHGYLTELAGDNDPAILLGLLPMGERAELRDEKRGVIRAATIADNKLVAAIFIAREGQLPPRDWLIAQLAGERGGEEEASPNALLAGRPATPQADRGTIICVCFDIGINTILETVRSQSLTNVEAVGSALYAGTNCGSCRPAISRLLAQELALVTA
jgi:assimilatory nitrate reductase catalytic subunit